MKRISYPKGGKVLKCPVFATNAPETIENTKNPPITGSNSSPEVVASVPFTSCKRKKEKEKKKKEKKQKDRKKN
jgi:hypothetical protein